MSENEPEAVVEDVSTLPEGGDAALDSTTAMPAPADEEGEPGAAGDPDHGLPGEVEPLPDDDAGAADDTDAAADDTDG